MTSGGNSFNYFPENQLTKFISVPPKISMTQHASSPRIDAPGWLQRSTDTFSKLWEDNGRWLLTVTCVVVGQTLELTVDSRPHIKNCQLL